MNLKETVDKLVSLATNASSTEEERRTAAVTACRFIREKKLKFGAPKKDEKCENCAANFFAGKAEGYEAGKADGYELGLEDGRKGKPLPSPASKQDDDFRAAQKAASQPKQYRCPKCGQWDDQFHLMSCPSNPAPAPSISRPQARSGLRVTYVKCIKCGQTYADNTLHACTYAPCIYCGSPNSPFHACPGAYTAKQTNYVYVCLDCGQTYPRDRVHFCKKTGKTSNCFPEPPETDSSDLSYLRRRRP
jgi:Zn finger protein HypA/HybF involved in hydrogenase expression